MSDHSELKKYAEIALSSHENSSLAKSLRVTSFYSRATPGVVLALIAEVEGLRAQHGRDSAELRSLCQARDDARKERDQLKAEVARSTEREIMQLAEIEALRKSVEFGADCFRKISSGDGSGHADLAESILRRAGSAMGKGEQP